MKGIFRGGFRELLLRFLSRVHCALPVAVGCAAVFELLDHTGYTAFLRGLLFIVPVALSAYAVERLPALWQFLAASLGISALSWLLLGHPGGGVLAALVCFFRGRARLSEEKSRSLLDVPYYSVLLVFGAAFCLSAFVGIPVLQRLSVISAALYFLVCLTFHSIERLENYLALNRDMHGLPARRIRRIAGGAVAAAVMLAAALLLPAAFQTAGDFRMTLPQWKSHGAYTPPKPTQVEADNALPHMEELFGEKGPSFQFPPFLSYLLYALAAGGAVGLGLYGIYRLFRHFRASYTDSRDLVQYLGRGSDGEEKEEPYREKRRLSGWDRSPNAQIRRYYRKRVGQKSPEPPKLWQSPAEIESWAGLDTPFLHELYEKARYGPVSCTREDVKRLKEADR